MKKSIAILSMALLAGNAFAADVLEAGTEEAPKYYVIKANRGLPYVTYTEDEIDNGGALTTLYRANELSEAAVWAVVPGTEDGTINIYNYTTKDDKRKQYMFSFVTKDGAEFVGAANSGTATTGGAKDIFVKDNGNGSYGLALENETGVVDGQLWGLDATGGTSQFLGNWQSIGDGGTQWWFFAVDASNIEKSLQDIEYAALKDAMEAQVKLYSNSMASYAAAVPWVKGVLTEGVEAFGKLEVSADYQDQIDAIWSEYIGKANADLNTMFADKEVALNNLRKYNAGAASILGENESGTYNGVTSFAGDENGVFILESTVYEELPSYYLLNKATQKYFGPDRSAVDTKEEACSVRFLLQTGKNSSGANPIVGLNILANGVEGTNALNFNNATPPALSYWLASGNDSDGSIWSVLSADEESIVEFVTASSIGKLEPYLTKVPEMVANLLNAGIAEIKALPNTEDLAEKAEEIVDNTIEDANELLTTGMNGVQQIIYYPRGNRYLSYSAENEDWAAAATNDSENEVFTIKTVEGGVVLFNEANNIYVGPTVLDAEQTNATAVTEESEAIVFTVELNNNSGYYGVSFLFEEEYEAEVEGEDGETITEIKTRDRALNMNLNPKCLHSYGKADGGSIFVLQDLPKEDSITEISVAPAAKGIYDLAGRKLAAPVKGINIINGVKVLVK